MPKKAKSGFQKNYYLLLPIYTVMCDSHFHKKNKMLPSFYDTNDHIKCNKVLHKILKYLAVAC